MVEVVEAIPILVLVPQTGLEAEGNAFLVVVLGYDEGQERNPDADDQRGQWRSLFEPTFVRFSDAENETLVRYHAVIVSSLGQLPPAVVQKLEAYVRDGGLWLMLGGADRPRRLQSTLVQRRCRSVPDARVARAAGRPRQRRGGDPPARRRSPRDGGHRRY